MRWLAGLVAVAALFYVAAATLLYFQQGRLIYPAPQDIAKLPYGFREAELKTADGLTLRAVYSPARTGRPTVVYFHGNGGTLTGSAAATGHLVAQNYGALLVEYRGYGGNSGTPSEEGFYADGRAALRFLIAQGIAADQLILIGNSIGSGTATQLATEIQPKALILGAPFTSLPDAVADKVGWLPVSLLIRDRFDNAGKIAELEVPALIQHGQQDSLIAHSHGKRLAQLAPDATFENYSDAGHEVIFTPQARIAQVNWLSGLD